MDVYAVRWELKVFYRHTSPKDNSGSNSHWKWRWNGMMDGSDNINASMSSKYTGIFLINVLFSPVQDIQLRWRKVWGIDFFPLTLVIQTAECQQVNLLYESWIWQNTKNIHSHNRPYAWLIINGFCKISAKIPTLNGFVHDFSLTLSNIWNLHVKITILTQGLSFCLALPHLSEGSSSSIKSKKPMNAI